MQRKSRHYQNYRNYPDDKWDGIDRRNFLMWDGIDRRVPVIEKPEPKWYQSPALSIMFTGIMAVASFVFSLNNRVSSLEYQMQTFKEFEKEVKVEFINLKDMAKEHAAAHDVLSKQIAGLEMSVMEVYRESNHKKTLNR
jgi:hypothetical protein